MRVRLFLAQLLLLTGCAVVGLADEKGVDKKKLFEDYTQKFGTPGPEHKLLEPLVGTWEAKVKFWMDPGESPQTSEGTLVRKSILDGRFVQEQYEGKIADKPFHGVGMRGYDRGKKKYTATWADSMSTALHECEGTYDDATKTWTFRSECECPITGKHVTMRDTLRIVSPDEERLEMYRQLGDEKEMKMMEITLNRKK
jgi:hypothetical protein